MADLINRQAAIDALGEKPLAWTEGEYELGLQNQWQSDVDALKGLPSAQPERKTGRWVLNDNGTWSCDKCHSWIPDEQHHYAEYCLFCGAKMEVEHDLD